MKEGGERKGEREGERRAHRTGVLDEVKDGLMGARRVGARDGKSAAMYTL